MSSTLSSLGPALQPDGTLKDASELLWSYNTDEALPFPSSSKSTSSGRLEAAEVIDGLCQTTHVSQPSHHILEALNAESASSAPVCTHIVKHKAPNNNPEPG
jgi:hypothetical protein